MRRRATSPQALALLAALLDRARQWSHGYDLSKETGLKSGTLYPLLMRLADQSLLEADWRESPQAGRPPRHVYRLTAHGRAFAKEALPSRRRSALPHTLARDAS
jgi:DNA-binding PadR family transcriptional regulator